MSNNGGADAGPDGPQDAGLPGGVADADSSFGDAPVDSSTQPCPPQYQFTDCRWRDTSAYCGDNARLFAVVSTTPPDGPATIDILHPTTRAVLQTINGQLTGGRIDATWVAKAATANWRTDHMKFRVNIPHISLNRLSGNDFTFQQRPTTNWTLINDTSRCSHGGGHRARYDIRLESNRVHLSLKIKAGTDNVPDASMANFKTNAKQRIETVWNNGFNNKSMHRVNCQRGDSCDCRFDCCKVDFRADVNFVTSGHHFLLKVVGQPNPAVPSVMSWVRYNDSEWAYPPVAPTSCYPHEFGHMIGQFDEYVSSCSDPAAAGTQYRQPQPPPAAELNLMSTSGNIRLLNRHYRHMLAYLNQSSGGDTYKLIPAGP